MYYVLLSLSLYEIFERKSELNAWLVQPSGNLLCKSLCRESALSSNLHFIPEDLIEGKVRVWRLEGGQGQVSVTDVLVNQSG